MKSIDIATAKKLIDFSGGDEKLKSLAEVQIKGAVSLQNMIANPDIGFAYLGDEVGMGKTYMALGVVALMRYFNPILRVLYICPSRNVQEKWDKEYKNFVRNNVRVSQGRIRTQEGHPAAPYKSCNNLSELLHAAASGYYADFFVRKDSFSIGLSEDESNWKDKLKELKKIIPAHDWLEIFKTETDRKKIDVKKQYAKALNYILPTFDLVVIDEAHNFKHDFESSDRNKILSRVLGFYENDKYMPKVKQALFLSATPYDRNLNQLRNQLKLVGKEYLLPESVDESNSREYLKQFLVRRLNTICINDVSHTRNMYRREWRKEAGIKLETDEQKLVIALVQKKVGEMLSSQSESASFQTGLLASFESFAESTSSEPVEFDGDKADKQQTDARDRHVIGHISDSYKDAKLGRTLPHPKMDSVVNRLSKDIFEKSTKQLVFVRRVKSVDEIKDKLDEKYNIWIERYIANTLKRYPEQKLILEGIYKSYCNASRYKDRSDIGGEYELNDVDASLPAKNDTFFAWFFRGEVVKSVPAKLKIKDNSYPTPDGVRKSLSVKNQITALLMEPNWALFICIREGLKLHQMLEEHGEQVSIYASKYTRKQKQQPNNKRILDDHIETYNASQIGFIEFLVKKKGKKYLTKLLKRLIQGQPKESAVRLAPQKVKDYLHSISVLTEIERTGLADELNPYQMGVYDALKNSDKNLDNLFKLFEIHKTLMSFVLRTGHGIIDLYLSRLIQGASNLSKSSRSKWVIDFVKLLHQQKNETCFSTYYELLQISSHLELIIKNNIPQILDITRIEYSKHISQALNPVSPVIGASGVTTGRSSQARKFRMPGYPLALISTDVFQEGEDLHTFCDSVVHYGLSSAPISIEQKIGRVDRVSSLAQRRLTELDSEASDDDYIQVSFPFVKESIEALQVRQVCHNLNEFIESLHHVSSTKLVIKDNVDMVEALSLKKPIPDQIRSFLKSPYDSPVKVKNSFNGVSLIKNNEDKRKAEISRIYKLVNVEIKKRINAGVNYYVDKKFNFDKPDDTYIVNLCSAKSNGELILSITKHAESSDFIIKNQAALRKVMFELSWQTFHRTFSIKVPGKINAYQLFFNSEMLVGEKHNVSENQIEYIFDRMDHVHNPRKYNKDLSKKINGFVNSINSKTRISVDRSQHTTIEVDTVRGVTTLVFKYDKGRSSRSHKVMIYECDGRCVFLSNATRKGFCSSLKVDEVIKYTWQRNRNIDLVEFVVDPKDAIVGRIVHPLVDMTNDEFLYCAYILAVEADDLEYLLSHQDVY